MQHHIKLAKAWLEIADRRAMHKTDDNYVDEFELTVEAEAEIHANLKNKMIFESEEESDVEMQLI